MQGTPQQGRSPHRKQTVVPLDGPEALVEIVMALGDAQTNGGWIPATCSGCTTASATSRTESPKATIIELAPLRCLDALP